LFNEILIPVVAGLAATTAMTMFVLLLHLLTGQQLNVIRILGTMLTSSTTTEGGCSKKAGSQVAGTIAHYAVGLFFSFAYIWMWRHQLIKTDWFTTAILGFVTGMFGIIVWKSYFRIHSNPPFVPMRLYLACILFAHVIYSWTARWVAGICIPEITGLYQALQHN
jgi:hypothetical protein